jgi:nucleolar protein 12
VKRPITSENERGSQPHVNAPENQFESQDSDSESQESLDKTSLKHGQESVRLESMNVEDGSSPPALPDRHGRSEKTRNRRRNPNDDIEGLYLNKLAQEELKEISRRRSEQSHEAISGHSEAKSKDLEDMALASDDSISDIPQHETIESKVEDDNLEKASRTVFLGNVSTTAISSKTANKTLKNHLSAFLPLFNTSKSSKPSTHKLESIRFRSTAYSSTTIPKRAAFAKQELMDTTTSSTNAYVVYSTPTAARQACKVLNGTVILDRHLRVDGVAHPARTDPKRCVFVGNLDFVDKESPAQNENGDRPRRPRAAGDVEEGLWRQFEKAGTVESVRVVRDSKTRIGKGFGYVQFEVSLSDSCSEHSAYLVTLRMEML